jgi:hypothetical protein
MSTWVRALCTKPLGGVTPDALRAAVARRLPALAALYGEDGEAEAVARLHVEDADPAHPASVWRLGYRGDASFLRVERWSAPARVREEVEELSAGLADCDEEGVEDVRALLGDVVETVGIELKMSDVEGIGWPVAIAAAACFAERGDGLIQADGEGWMQPEGSAVAHVLDGD